MVTALANNPDLADDIKPEITTAKTGIQSVNNQIVEASNVDSEFREFSEFALGFADELRGNFWDLEIEEMRECEQMLFPSDLLVNDGGKVHTPLISPIYTLLNAKDDPKVVKNADMEELAGTAPASAGLSLAGSSTGLVRFAVLGHRYLNGQTSYGSNPGLSTLLGWGSVSVRKNMKRVSTIRRRR